MADIQSTTIASHLSNLTTTNYMAMVEPDGISAPKEVNPVRGVLVKYRVVFVYYTPYAKYSNPQGLASSVDTGPVLNITLHPPDHFSLPFYNNSDRPIGFYCHGDPGSWDTLYPSRDKTVEELDNFEIMVTEKEFLAENARDRSTRTMTSETLRTPDDDENYIVKDPSGDAVLDDNGHRMVLLKFTNGPSDKTEGLSVLHLKRIINGQGTVLTDREEKRLQRYLAGGFDGDDEARGQGGEDREEEVQEPDGSGDQNKQEE